MIYIFKEIFDQKNKYTEDSINFKLIKNKFGFVTYFLISLLHVYLNMY